MSADPKQLDIAIDGIKFSCIKQPAGEWHCYGKIKGIGYGLKFPNSAPTHVFQHIENIVKNRI